MKTTNFIPTSFATCWLQAPCVITTPVGEAQQDANRYMADLIQNTTAFVRICMPGLLTTSLSQSAEHMIANHPALAQDDNRLINALLPVQSWLRGSSLERSDKTGCFEAPSGAVFGQRLKDAVIANQQAVTELTECTDKVDAFAQLMPHWMKLLENSHGSGIKITAETAAQLAQFGAVVSKLMLTEIEWVLVLACMQVSLERAWLACNTAHQVAYLSVQRGLVVGMVSDQVQRQLLGIRMRAEISPSGQLPTGIQWIDQALADPLNAIWLRMAKGKPD